MKNDLIVLKSILVYGTDWVYNPCDFLSKYIWCVDLSSGFAHSQHIKTRALEYSNMSLDVMVKDSLGFKNPVHGNSI